LSGTNPDVRHLASGGDGLGQVQEAHAGNLGNKDLAAVHLIEAADHEVYALLQCQPKSGHTRVGDGDFAAAALLEKNGDHAAAAAHDVPVTRATEARIFRAG